MRLAKRLHQHTSSRKQACLLSLFSVTVLKAQGGKGDGAQTNVCCCSAEGGISSRSTPGARIAPSAKVPSPPPSLPVATSSASRPLRMAGTYEMRAAWMRAADA